eukprot:SAG31_NODE_703_length_12720_cov_10.185088_9_plen_77_part_00
MHKCGQPSELRVSMRIDVVMLPAVSPTERILVPEMLYAGIYLRQYAKNLAVRAQLVRQPQCAVFASNGKVKLGEVR